jgi:excisionase family DNA binding protein
VSASPSQQLSEGLTIREFARINNISESTARRYVNSGRIASYKVGGSRRIRVEDAAALQAGEPNDVEAAIARLVSAATPLTDGQRISISAALLLGRSGG